MVWQGFCIFVHTAKRLIVLGVMDMTIEVNSATILIIPMGDRIMRKHHLRFVVLYHCIVFYPLKAGFHFLCGLIVVAEDKILLPLS